MDLTTFRQHLQEMDRLNDSVAEQMFDCRARSLECGAFAYEFDGQLTCIVAFEPDGRVLDWVDVHPMDWARSGCEPTRTHASIREWIETTTTELRSPL